MFTRIGLVMILMVSGLSMASADGFGHQCKPGTKCRTFSHNYSRGRSVAHARSPRQDVKVRSLAARPSTKQTVSGATSSTQIH